MALGGFYNTGTITIGADKITVTGVGSLWKTFQIEVGDWLLCNGQVNVVGNVVSETQLVLQTEWIGTLPSAAQYTLVLMSWLRFDPSLTQAKLRQLLADLKAEGSFVFTSVAPPDPAAGEDGQWALKTDTSPWRLWYKVDGVWIEQATPAGLVWRGVWSSATAYAPGDGVSQGGSSYVAILASGPPSPITPPNATYWNVLAQQGATGTPGTPGAPGAPGLLWRGTWAGSIAYAVNDGVAYSGASYICVTAHTSSAGTPPPNANWDLLAGASSATIADRSITPIKLDADLQSEKDAFANEITAVKRGGDTMTGHLVLPTGPAASNAVRKDYVDTADATLTTAVNNRVRWDAAQGLAASQQEQGRKNIYAAPFDALGYFGMQINGSMEVCQELGTAAAVLGASGTIYLADLFQTAVSGLTGASFSGARSGAGNDHWIYLSCSATGTVAAGSFGFIQHCIEADRIARAYWGSGVAQPITIMFIVNSSVAGPLALAIRNSDGTRSYVTLVTINTANAWEVKTVTIPGDQAGTWLTEPGGVGLKIAFGIASGTTYQTSTLNAWQAGNFLSHASAINYAISGRGINIASFFVVKGNEAPTGWNDLRGILRPYTDEIDRVRRYWQKTYPYGIAVGGAGNAGAITNAAGSATASRPFLQWQLPIRMRTAPAAVAYSPATGAANNVRNVNAATDVAATIYSFSETEITAYPNGTPATGDAFSAQFTANARFT